MKSVNNPRNLKTHLRSVSFTQNEALDLLQESHILHHMLITSACLQGYQGFHDPGYGVQLSYTPVKLQNNSWILYQTQNRNCSCQIWDLGNLVAILGQGSCKRKQVILQEGTLRLEMEQVANPFMGVHSQMSISIVSLPIPFTACLSWHSCARTTIADVLQLHWISSPFLQSSQCLQSAISWRASFLWPMRDQTQTDLNVSLSHL